MAKVVSLLETLIQPVSTTRPVKTDNEGIDQLLAELTISDETIFAKKTFTANPLELAAKHRQNQNNENRKSWASTRTLPIDDFNAMFPNPAMKFPFTLDEFQQQAVARLERSESVFVAAHTSAGYEIIIDAMRYFQLAKWG